MIHIIAQPGTNYYTWQVETVINSILENCPGNKIHIVNSEVPNDKLRWKLLEIKYKNVEFFYYKDTRKNPYYISSIRPHILQKHFEANKYLTDEVIFYHDSDIVFTKPFPTDMFINDDIWYLSDTISYIGFDYIKSKGDDILELMTNICDISIEVIKDNQNNSGGAQYIMKNVDSEYWGDVYMDSENLFYEVSKLNEVKKNENVNYHELQIWCADMWAVLWNSWKRGFKTTCPKEMNFSWATSHISKWEEWGIYHNAGVTSNTSGMFYKSDYNNLLPYNIQLNDLRTYLCSYNYFNYIKEINNKTLLNNTISIVILCTNSYKPLGIRFINNFIKHYKGNKKIIFHTFTELDLEQYINEYDKDKFNIDFNYFKNDDWVTGTNSKFSNILSLEGYGQWIYYFDADTNITKDFNEEWFLGDIVGGEHYNNKWSDVKNYDRNISSRAYIPSETILEQTYFYGAFFGGISNNILNMCKILYDNQISDKNINYEPGCNDESYINHYFHYNKPSKIVPSECFEFIISDKGSIDDIRNNPDVTDMLQTIESNKLNDWNIINGKIHLL